jgi:hypothetical protein
MPSPGALGPQVAYLAIKEGTPVYDRSGTRVGVVEHVMDEGGIFEGVVVHTYPLPGRHLYADADQIDNIHQRGIVLSVGRVTFTTRPSPRSARGVSLRKLSRPAYAERWIGSHRTSSTREEPACHGDRPRPRADEQHGRAAPLRRATRSCTLSGASATATGIATPGATNRRHRVRPGL